MGADRDWPADATSKIMDSKPGKGPVVRLQASTALSIQAPPAPSREHAPAACEGQTQDERPAEVPCSRGTCCAELLRLPLRVCPTGLRAGNNASKSSSSDTVVRLHEAEPQAHSAIPAEPSKGACQGAVLPQAQMLEARIARMLTRAVACRRDPHRGVQALPNRDQQQQQRRAADARGALTGCSQLHAAAQGYASCLAAAEASAACLHQSTCRCKQQQQPQAPGLSQRAPGQQQQHIAAA